MFSWIKWSNESRVQSRHSRALLKTSEAAASHILIRELLFHVEEQERLREQRQSALGYSQFQKYPKLQTIFTTAELQQLEFLCAQIPPTHTAKVISRYLIWIASNFTLVCTMQSNVAWCIPTKGLTAGTKPENTQRGCETRGAAREAIMRYCHRCRR